MKKLVVLVVGLLVFASTFGFTLLPESEITAHWRKFSPGSPVEVEHTAWDELLKRHIFTEQGINLFAYSSVTSADKNKLKNYIEYLQTIAVTELERKEQFAYWINLYNALVVQIIVENYPLESIQEISYGLFSLGPWRQKLVYVEGIDLSLDNIEHQILRPIFKDNRIHYAVNCASMGCPNLQAQAYTRENLEALLDLGAEQYISHPRGVSFNNGQLIVSSIFDWYAEDFGDNDHQIIMYLIRFVDSDLKGYLQDYLQGRQSIDKFRYDWSLNESSLNEPSLNK
ncbi:DUF547 domain-containing protein [Candidatus Spongiihabitans sp.]|uniref:DUF547 domain-containing protein n=1 Tax=Candidatus Spongiihabitans sp. TaxID=3101308 RepID=UPI003C7041D4